MCLGFGKKRERERGNRREKIRSFSFPFSLSVSLSLFRVHGTNNFVSRETRHNKKRHDATLCLQHKARVLPARKLSRRNPPRRRDGASSSTRVVFGARILSLPFFRLLHFCALQIGKMSLSGGMMVGISSRPESARARVFFPRVSSPSRTRAVASGRGRIVDTVVGLFLLRRRLADIIRSNRSLSFPHLSSPKQIGF